MYNICVNGKNTEIKELCTLEQLLAQLDINNTNIIIELDGEIVLKEDFAKTSVCDKSSVEIIKFVGGG